MTFSGEQLCKRLEILNDSILEPIQTFSVVISSAHYFVNIMINEAIITIIDDDCKLI